MLLKDFDNEIDQEWENLRPIMRYKGVKSHICCLAHALNRIVQEILKELKSGTVQEAEDGEDDAGLAGPIAKLWHIVVWIGRTTQQEQYWKKLSPLLKMGRDLDIRWNSTHDLMANAIRCKSLVIQLIKDFPELKEWSLGQPDWIFVAQLYQVLHPFNEYTKLASSDRPTIDIVQSIYLELSTLFKKVGNQEDKYATLDIRIVNAFRSKGVSERFKKYSGYVDDCPIYSIASILDPRIKGSLLETEYLDGNTQLAQVRKWIHELYPLQKPTSQDEIQRPRS